MSLVFCQDSPSVKKLHLARYERGGEEPNKWKIIIGTLCGLSAGGRRTTDELDWATCQKCKEEVKQ